MTGVLVPQTMVLPARLDAYSVSMEMVDVGAGSVIDGSRVRFADSAGLRYVLRCVEAGACLVCPSPVLLECAGLAGVALMPPLLAAA